VPVTHAPEVHVPNDTVLDYEASFVRDRPGSAALYARAGEVFPSGVTHDARYLSPFPLYMRDASGPYKWDVDGHRYIDYAIGHGALMFGHAHPTLVEAVQAQVARGTHFGAAHELEVEWGEWTKRLIPSAERVRFTASGTEATHMAIRLARSFTGRTRVLKFEGHFHGWHDAVTAGVEPPYDVPSSSGVPGSVLDAVVVLPPDLERVEAALSAGDIAAVIVEPTGAAWGALPIDADFLHGLREATRATGTVLIFDEVITGFRCAPGGAQEVYGITPDLTTLAKILAGGLPGGAVCGRLEIMDIIRFGDNAAWNRGRRIAHPGTYNGNPLSAVAGTAALKLCADGTAQAHANRLGARLRDGLNAVGAKYDLEGCAYGTFSMFHLVLDRGRLHAEGGPIYVKGRDPRVTKLRKAMIVQGVDFFSTGGMVSAVHSDADIDVTVAAFARAMDALDKDGTLA
jgi:glutamate-1-semialdehyde 2,1-aminomutase